MPSRTRERHHVVTELSTFLNGRRARDSSEATGRQTRERAGLEPLTSIPETWRKNEVASVRVCVTSAGGW